MAAAFNFDGYQIKNLEYKLDEEKDRTLAGREVNFQVGVASNNEDPNKYRIELITTVKGNPAIQLSIFGFLTSTGYFESSEVMESAKMVGASILYPYARSIISSISVQDSNQGIILPTINLLELFSDNSPNKDTSKKASGSE